MSPAWRQAQAVAANGNLPQLQQVVRQNIQADSSLTGYLSAVSALSQAKASAEVLAPYRAQAKQLAQQQIQAGVNVPTPWVATGLFALEDRDPANLRSATNHLLQRFPQDPHGHYFAGVQSIEQGDWRAAEESLRTAQRLGMPADSLANLLKLAIDNQRWVWQYAKLVVAIIGLWLIGLGALTLVGRWLSRAVTRAAVRPNPQSRDQRERRLRSFYRAVVGVAGMYYYLSLPMVLIASVALPLSLGYATLMMPFLNLGLLAVVLVGGLAGIITAVSGFRTALIRLQERPFGRRLTPTEAPQFWDVVCEVAERMETRPVDEIWVTPETELAVREEGSWWARRQGRSKRVLIFGLGLVPDFRVDELRSVLAHEYAHFQNRDTAGGDIAYHVQGAMYRLAEAIEARGAIRAWDITVWYLRYFFRLFHQLTFGASRLQEVLADRAAVECYGGSALIAGLGHVVRRSFEFNLLLSNAVRQGSQGANSGHAFYSPRRAITSEEAADLDAEIRDLYQQPTTEADTHPSLHDRCRAARQSLIDRPVGPAKVAPLLGDAGKPIVQEMNQLLGGLVEGEAKKLRTRDKHVLEYLNSALRSEPSIEMWEARAAIHYRAGEFQAALEDLNAILTELPNDASALLSRSRVFEALKQPQQTVSDLQRLRGMSNALPPELQREVACRLGAVYLKFNKHSAAAQAFNAALELAPHSLNAVVGRLQAAAGQEELQAPRMQQLLQQAVELWPEEKAIAALAAASGRAEEFAQKSWQARAKPPAARISEPPVPAYDWRPLAAAIVGVLAIGTRAYFLAQRSWGEQQSLPEIVQTAEASPTLSAPLPPPRASVAISPDNPTSVIPGVPDLTEFIPPEPLSLGEPDQSLVGEPELSAAKEPVPRSQPLQEELDDTPEPPVEPLELEVFVQQAEAKLLQLSSALRKYYKAEGALDFTPIGEGDRQFSWRVKLLPYLGQQALYDEFRFDEPWYSDHNHRLIKRMPEVFQLESNRGHTRIQVRMSFGLLVKAGQPCVPKTAPDGPDLTTLLFVVGLDKQCVWTRPDDSEFDGTDLLGSVGLGESSPVCLLMANGKPRSFPQGLHAEKFWALATAEGKEPINPEVWFANPTDPPPPVITLQPPPPQYNPPPLPNGPPPTEKFVKIPSPRVPRESRPSVDRPVRTDEIANKVKRIGLALAYYQDTHDCFPVTRKKDYCDERGIPKLSWRVHILPYIDQTPLYERFHLNEPWDSSHNRELLRFMPEEFKTDPREQDTTRLLRLEGDYLAFAPGRDCTYRTFDDGTSNTLLVVRVGADKAAPWTKPQELALDLKRPRKSLGRLDPETYCLRADFNVMCLPRTTPDDVWAALATPRGRELLDGATVSRFALHSLRKPTGFRGSMTSPEVNSLKNLLLAMLNHESARYQLPTNICRIQNDQVEPLLSWRVALLPYLEHNNLYREFHLDEPWDSPHNRKLIDYMPDMFRDANDPVSQTNTRYVRLIGNGALYASDADQARWNCDRINDGTSSTMLLYAANENQAVPWTKPVDLPFDRDRPERTFGPFAPDERVYVGFANGAVMGFPPTLDLKTLSSFVTPNGQELVNPHELSNRE